MAERHPTLAELVALLPEIYQPIHGHPELSDTVSRACDDRWTQIAILHDTLQTLLGLATRQPTPDTRCDQPQTPSTHAARAAGMLPHTPQQPGCILPSEPEDKPHQQNTTA